MAAGVAIQEFAAIHHGNDDGERAPDGWRPTTIPEGSIFLLFPGARHRHAPDRRTGWVEHWIECGGKRLQFRMRRRLGATGATKQLRDFRFVHFDPRVGAARYRAQSAAHLNPWTSVAGPFMPAHRYQQKRIRQARRLCANDFDGALRPAAFG
ncbi:AraC family ligand binding domain-containing protein [Rhizobium sp. 814_E9_N1_1]|uniref:AraC-type arabinose-binding/dimerisation domain-containing protein n=1 Tax=Rhizobium leguminosarum TaxID=384 RepID=A0A7M3E391_RHILE|nr:hypothetical protein ELH90_08485 [Rhizobium leguminosarum]